MRQQQELHKQRQQQEALKRLQQEQMANMQVRDAMLIVV